VREAGPHRPPDMLKRDPDLIRAFVPPSLKGFIYGRQHMEEAIAAVKKYQPTADDAVTKREFELSWETWIAPLVPPVRFRSANEWTNTPPPLPREP
jgi:hypothetical protein